jgi:hypothetical protein
MLYTQKVKNYIGLVLGADKDTLLKEVDYLATKIFEGVATGANTSEYKQAYKLVKWELSNR